MSAKLVIELPRADRDWVDHKKRKGRIPAGAGARNGCFIRTLLLIVPDIRKIVWDAKSYWTAGRRLLSGVRSAPCKSVLRLCMELSQYTAALGIPF